MLLCRHGCCQVAHKLVHSGHAPQLQLAEHLLPIVEHLCSTGQDVSSDASDSSAVLETQGGKHLKGTSLLQLALHQVADKPAALQSHA